MNYRIVCDSSANMFSFPNADFRNVPLTILVEDQPFVDDGMVNIKAMEDAMRNSKEKTGSSCPNIYQWQQAFEGADCIFAITITSALSGAYNSALQAADQYMAEHPEVKIDVIDSLSTGPEMQIIAEKLAELFQEGKDFETIKKEIAEYQHHTHLLYSLQSLRNLAKNGRINPAVAKVLGLLGICIIGRASDEGTVELVDKCRGAKKANRIVMGYTQLMPISWVDNGDLAFGGGNYAIYVNPTTGKRYVNETGERDVLSLGEFENGVSFDGSNGTVIEIANSNQSIPGPYPYGTAKDTDLTNWESDVENRQYTRTVDQLGDLFQSLGFKCTEEEIRSTIEEYDKALMSGKSTELDPAKTGWTALIGNAQKDANGNYDPSTYTLDGVKLKIRLLAPSTHHTMGGVTIDENRHEIFSPSMDMHQ